MNITVWGINYAPEVTGIGPYNKLLCDAFRNNGDQVRMVTGFGYYPNWKKQGSDQWRLYRTDRIDGIPVYRCWQYVPAKPSAWKRIVHEGSFILSSFLRLLLLPRPDLLVVISPPLGLGAAAAFLCWIRRTRFVFHVQDLQPDAAVGLGMVKPGLVTRLLYRLEAFAYHTAHRVSGISDGMLEAFRRKGVPDSKIISFPNSVRLNPKRPPLGEFRKKHQFSQEDFLVVYSGNLGVKQGLEVVIEAAAKVGNPRVQIVICGDGAARYALEERVLQAKLQNVRLIPLQDDLGYREMLTDADVSLITQQRGSGAFFFPSKLLSNLAFGKAVVTVADQTSELGRAMQRGRFGVNVEPGDVRRLAEVFEFLAGNPTEVKTYAENGLRFVAPFEVDRVMRRYRDDLEAALVGTTDSPREEFPVEEEWSTRHRATTAVAPIPRESAAEWKGGLSGRSVPFQPPSSSSGGASCWDGASFVRDSAPIGRSILSIILDGRCRFSRDGFSTSAGWIVPLPSPGRSKAHHGLEVARCPCC